MPNKTKPTARWELEYNSINSFHICKLTKYPETTWFP